MTQSAPRLQVVAGHLSDAELAAVVVAVTAAAARVADASSRSAQRVAAWRRAGLVEQTGAASVASPRELDAAAGLG